ncbi:helicase-related protein [Jannaschia sp. LMIT008]|uniref:helicase-related protein n=1 Tax=Jannaschia maritima TaxID=3032585 RepID=UPI0028110BA3|nr:helicase-related protein [Jannaschia sp. LMIT008]
MTGRVTAVLGPTNTGKTHYAIERMLAHRTGVIGLPLRLLAREVYDKLVAARGPSVVALVTGEERIVPPRAAYWVCTVEAMPQGTGADFVAIDEIQLCADPERGHVFTDRLLNMRGQHETLFMGADTMRRAIARLVPEAGTMRRERFSELTYVGPKKISRMPGRTAIVGFSVDSVYAIAELLRRQKGGAAVVMGALSPRTRNAQVAMYQNGDVDHLVATDAIGMGLNLDIRHVAFSATSKFDGRRVRPLHPHELGQIAGRAGRFTEPGTFGTTGEAQPIDPDLAGAITEHRFKPIDRLMWRNDRLDFRSAETLIASLEASPDDEMLVRGRDADDLSSLRVLSDLEGIRARLRDARDVRLLWDVCRIPDFQGIAFAEHTNMLARIFDFLHGQGRMPEDWFARQVKRIDRTQGDIDTLSKRLAYIRTWTYVAQRKGWVENEDHWRDATRAVEDRLSDALHQALTARFVDRRTSVLLKRLKMKEGLVAEIDKDGTVTVEGEALGRLEGFRFHQTKSTTPDEAKTVGQAAAAALRPELHLRADRFYNAPDTEIDFTEQGGLMWGGDAVGKLAKGDDVLKPQVVPFVDEEAGPDVADKVRRRLGHFIDRKVAAAFEPLLAMEKDEGLTGIARGFAFRLREGLGVLPRGQVAQEVRDLDQDARGSLRKHGVRFGQFTVFGQQLLKPAPTRLRLVLWSLWQGLDEFPEAPPPGLVTVPAQKGMPEGYFAMAGYRAAGARAIRIDMLERLADMIRGQDTRSGFEATPDMLSITGMTLEQFAELMGGLGYAAERGERPKVRATKPDAAPAPAPAEGQGTGATEGSVTTEDAAAATAAMGKAAADAAVAAVGEPTPAPGAGADAAVPPATPDPDAPADIPEPPPAEDPGDIPPVEDPTPTQDPDLPPMDPPPADLPPADAPSAPAMEASDPADDAAASDAAAPADTGDGPAGEGVPDGDPAPAPATGDAAAPAEVEVFYTFTWSPRRQNARGPRRDADGGGDAKGRPRGKQGGRPGGKQGGKPRGPRPDRDAKGGGKPKIYQSRPDKRDKPIDPDNPFAALAALKDK